MHVINDHAPDRNVIRLDTRRATKHGSAVHEFTDIYNGEALTTDVVRILGIIHRL